MYTVYMIEGGAMATTVVSGRVDADVKRRADAVIREAGTSVGEVIKNMWELIAETGAVPERRRSESEAARRARALARLREVCDGLPPCPNVASLTDDDVKAMMVSRHV